jgi:hypothetical protein
VSGRSEQPSELGLGHPQQGANGVDIDAQLGSDPGGIGSSVVQPQDRGVYLGELRESRREIHTSTLGRADGGVGSNDLLDFREPTTRPGRADYPIWRERRAAGLGVEGPSTELASNRGHRSPRPSQNGGYSPLPAKATSRWAPSGLPQPVQGSQPEPAE